MKKATKKPRKPSREIMEWLLTILAAFVIVLPIRAFGFEMVRVDGESMNGTLANGEITLVTKFEYATNWLSLPWQEAAAAENAARITTGGDPQRFDIVICRYPGRGNTYFVKRVVGLPGDVVELRNGYLYINGDRYDEPYVDDAYRSGPLNTFGPYRVPSGEYFVLGDHRNDSNDSRLQGSLTRDRIIGHVRCVLFPFAEIRGLE
ncbi:MAG: signal peptidase I [Clostridia bacterium]|nr:signal peptidase I [Clostridia bacterium]